ncbi:uncharacterized protein LAESUDRAFT_749161 [Laetiporus sulphureus 93-53]|uniref:BZIP domain-containing protein n=1 Tax=Laetiporus sulphureus 93-53 TaxID=1314785 RepID=A0A165EXT2_9APHY|nr:uncharacterized protein LAESUDRAFT_749161 [Laetiporus sulphureus 93-53]KZT07941.1 hypothetical protein LAESUDRAFT_749161 [Laetiporus sulphureus 93-53]
MLVDNPLPSGFSLNSSFEDFFNMDLLGGPSSGGSSPRSDSSPSESFSNLPPTPPNLFESDSVMNQNVNEDSFFGFSLDDFSKLDIPAPLAAPGFDFLGAFASAATQLSSPDSGSGSGGLSSMADTPSSIDPQLVTSPSPSNAVSEAGDADEDEEHEEDEDEHDEALSPDKDGEQGFSIAPIKVGGRGKANRKGTIQSGGVIKRAGSEKKENRPSNHLSTTSTEPDDWRPSPEEYKKMTSKEKRQLRNKISARNFRVRRKEYITTLEGDIAERDRLIDAIRTELGSTKSENVALRQEITSLKRALLEGAGRADTPILPPPAPLPAIPASVLASGPSANASAPAPPKSPLLTPNTQKDLPTSPRLGARGFWGGASSAGLGGYGGFTPVHTTLVPEWTSVLSGKPVANARTGRRSPALQENINPTLNAAWPSTDKSKEVQQQYGALESFMDMNPFTMKALDPYRMQLWRNMAAQQHYRRQHASHEQQQSSASSSSGSSSSSSSPNSSPSPSGLAGSLRPHFFTKQPASLSTLLSGKPAATSYPPASTSPLASITNKSTPLPTPQQAMLASVASQTLMQKLGSAFWDAFAARPAGGKRMPELDADKVRRVMEGSAVLRVVDVEPRPSASAARMQMQMQQHLEKSSSGPEKKCNITDILEESMRSLSISKK